MTTSCGWRVFASWVGIQDANLGLWAGPETCEAFPSWAKARQNALQLACLRGTRYISVQDPGDVVVGEYDRITNRWRECRRLGIAQSAPPS